MSNYPITEKFLMDVAEASPALTQQWIQTMSNCCDELEIPAKFSEETLAETTFRIMAVYTVKKNI